MKNHRRSSSRAYIELHIAVLLFGITAILGDLITLSATPLVWWRLTLTCLCLTVFARVASHIKRMPRRRIIEMLCNGFLVGLHWLTFFASIKAANASVGLICLSTTSFITALLEPIFTKKQHSKFDLLLGILIVVGMAILVSNLTIGMWEGVMYGLLSAFFASVFTIFNRKIIAAHNAFAVTLVELFGALILISVFMVFTFDSNLSSWIPNPRDWTYLLILSILCTAIGYTLALRALRHLTAFVSNLTISLEPVYGIVLASWLLDDLSELEPSFYLGACLLLAAIFIHPLVGFWKRRSSRIHSPN